MHVRPLAVLVSLLAVAPLARPAVAQAPGKFPPDSLINTKVIPHNTPVTEVLGIMRGFTTDLGVRCGFCHVGKEGAPIASYDFASDEKRTKKTARQMMLMLAEVNRRLDTLPERKPGGLMATCNTCHRGVNRPVHAHAIRQIFFEALDRLEQPLGRRIGAEVVRRIVR